MVEKKVDAFIKSLEDKKAELITQRKSTVSNFFTSITPYNKSHKIKAIDALIENLNNNKKNEEFDPKSIAQHVHVLLDGETGKLIKKSYPELHEKLTDLTPNQSLKLTQ